eukprot:TRINITY_DN9699_c0_g1_i2.p1 TRINITY_DN9699_c0_g1~~TRINITY_DN9699_c0_g1_i2.p1  ORF type:complete len:131 (+),score=0.68 TRINITY_DN9699_c0_g1_i2:60-395(+)
MCIRDSVCTYNFLIYDRYFMDSSMKLRGCACEYYMSTKMMRCFLHTSGVRHNTGLRDSCQRYVHFLLHLIRDQATFLAPIQRSPFEDLQVPPPGVMVFLLWPGPNPPCTLR